MGKPIPLTGSIRPRLCKNADIVLKSALLRKICHRLVNPAHENLRRRAIFGSPLNVNSALKRFYTASAMSGHLPFKVGWTFSGSKWPSR
jgi:hypothetical protein